MSTLPDPGYLRGAFVHCADGERIGVVEDVYVDDEGGHARYLGIATDWFGGRLTVVPVEDVRVADPDHIVLPYRAEDLRAAPSYAVHDDLTISREAEIYGHYGRTPYWEVVRKRQSTPAPTPEIAQAEAADARAGHLPPGGEDPEVVVDVAARQTEPAPTPAIVEAEVEDAVARGEDPDRVMVKRWSA